MTRKLKVTIKQPGRALQVIVVPLPNGVDIETSVIETEPEPYRGYVSDAELVMLRRIGRYSGGVIYTKLPLIQIAACLTKKNLAICEATTAGLRYYITDRGLTVLARRSK